jgi:hypothetical protein
MADSVAARPGSPLVNCDVNPAHRIALQAVLGALVGLDGGDRCVWRAHPSPAQPTVARPLGSPVRAPAVVTR